MPHYKNVNGEQIQLTPQEEIDLQAVKAADALAAEAAAALPPQPAVYTVPIVAPDFIVASPQVNPNPLDALAEAIAESKKPHGEHKSVALIALSLAHYLEDLEKRAKGKL